MKKLLMTLILMFSILPQITLADSFEVSVWIPYWSASSGIKDAKANLDQLTEINPFAFAVKKDGKLNDLFGMKKSAAKNLFKQANKENVRVIPTVMWSDTDNIHRILGDKDLREHHINEIVKMVNKGKYDGVDIDYEGKRAETKDYFSTFLIELKKELGDKTLVCTIEARTPPESLYTIIPNPLKYANDYKVIGSVCDRVQLMTYDQQRADLKLNAARIGEPYIPVGDVDWVRKVAEFTMKSIPKEKIVLGVATYGREWEVTVAPNWFKSYKQLWSVGHEYAEDFADDLDIEPVRNSAGELSYTYLPEDSELKFSKSLIIPKNTPEGNKVAAQALAHANKTGETVKFNIVWWSDAEAIGDKVKLVKELGLRGIAVFKIDGKEDPKLWGMLEDRN